MKTSDFEFAVRSGDEYRLLVMVIKIT